MKRFTVAIAIIAVCCGQVSAQDLPPDILADQYLLEAKRALESGKPETAIQAFRKIEALETEPPLEYAFFYGKLLVEHGASLDELLKGQSLLKQYVLSSARDSAYYTPTLELLSAVEAKLEVFKAVRELADAGIDVNAKDDEGLSPLHRAVRNGETEVVETLIAAGADVNAKDNDGESPLHRAARSGETEVVETLIAAGADVNAKDNYGESPLHRAARNSETKVVETLIAAGADVNAKDNYEYTPLFRAARYGTTKVVETLIAAGADVNAKDDDEYTPLFGAARYGTTKVVETLIAAGADVNAVLDEYSNYNEIMGAAIEKKRPEVVKMLIDSGAELFFFWDEDKTLRKGYLPWAARKGNAEIARMLIDAGGVVGDDLNDAARNAIFGRSEPAPIVKVLIDAGLNANGFVSNYSPDRWLHLATYKANPEIVKMLIAAGADVNARGKGRKRPLRIAESRGHTKVAAVLRAAGAKR